jgi:hypothetical protein
MEATMPQFETFGRDLSAANSTPSVTVLRRGAFSINRAAYTALGAPRSVQFLYDVSESIIGIQATDPSSDTAHRVRPTTAHGPVLVSAMAFLRFHQLGLVAATRWAAFLDDGVLCVDLKTRGIPVTSNRADTGRLGRGE